MKKKKEPKFKWGLCVIACLATLFYKGCGDTQSNEIVDVGDYTLQMLRPVPEFSSWTLDVWQHEPQPNDDEIYGAAFGWDIQLKDTFGDDKSLPGVLVVVKVTFHSDFGGEGLDLWEQETPAGKKYGSVKVFPEAGSKITEDDEGNMVVKGRTNADGKLSIFVGLGDPDIFDGTTRRPGTSYTPKPDYLWPDESITTLVELDVSIPNKPVTPLPTTHIWARFVRAQYQHFWLWGSVPGVIDVCMQGIGAYGSSSIESTTQKLTPDALDPNWPGSLSMYDSNPSQAKDRSANYPLVGTKTRTMTYVTASGVSLDSLDLTQLRWAYVEPWGWDWYYFPIEYGENLHALWVGDPNDPNCIADMLSVSQPYAFWADITLTEPFYGDTATATVILRALDNLNAVQSKIPLAMTLVEKSPDNMTLTFLSDWCVFSIDTNFHGYYQDQWQNPYTVIYAPAGTHPDLDFPEIFGDFNADDKVDFYDFALFANHWQDSVEDPNTGYDAMYEDPNTWDGEISISELKAFTEHWLW